ncbi:ArsR/SmtB family transcription factor [Roseovarius aestuarii]|uniref:Arsenical resistance operon repressor n=1 Tax=Roseovarius aestuarii TaxID=475083 RepID=A0A1X7BVX6_9RHOB|nr:metalloregulator ArsR/SmtB family transcription factor [Roseovarius aestuarii]SMC13796.1 Arsenical resistance operon repressor [Roseovarius aestuarii]
MRDTVSDERLIIQLKAMAHPARLKILQLLTDRGKCMCGEIVEVLPLTQSTVSQHLKILKEAGLLEGTINGPRSCYYVNAQAIGVLRQALSDCLAGFEAAAQLHDD